MKIKNKFIIKGKKDSRTMSFWQNSSSSGVTLIELMIVVAIMGIMTLVVLFFYRENKAGRSVDVSARQLSAAVKEIQNYALTGKSPNGATVCGWGIYYDIPANPNEYKIYYNTTTSPSGCSFVNDTGNPGTNRTYAASPTAEGTSSTFYATYAFKNNVQFVTGSDKTYFTLPHGKIFDQGGNGIGAFLRFLIQTSDATRQYTVCVYPAGKVEEKEGNTSC